jgi:hypothetical protein
MVGHVLRSGIGSKRKRRYPRKVEQEDVIAFSGPERLKESACYRQKEKAVSLCRCGIYLLGRLGLSLDSYLRYLRAKHTILYDIQL